MNMVQISKSVRIETGPARVTVVAKEKTLSNGVSPVRYQLGEKDAYGTIIKKNEKFTYLDDKGITSSWLWYLYQMDADGKYQKVSEHATQEAALEAGTVLSKELGEDPNLLKRLWQKITGGTK